MRDDVTTAGLRNLNHQRDVSLRECRARRSAGAPPIVRVDLDPIGAATDLIAHHTRQFFGAGGFLRPLRHVDFRREPTRSVCATHHNRARRNDQARPFDHAQLHRTLEPDVSVGRSFGTKVAQGCKTGAQRLLHVYCRARDAKAQRLLEHLIIPVRFVVRMQQHMGVQIDHSRHQRHAGQIDDDRIAWRPDVGWHPDRRDFAILHQHDNARDRRGAGAIEHTCGAEENRR